MPHVLIVDDDLSYLFGTAELVGREGFTTSTASSLAAAREELARQVPDVVLLDYSLPDGEGIELLEELRQLPDTDVIFVTGNASIESAVGAIRMGASNYLVKPVDFARIKAALATVEQTRRLKEQIGSLRGELRKLGHFGPLIGGSPAMQRVYDMVSKVAPSEATVMIVGETGTGKELVARAVHDLSRRRDEAFVAINCGAIAPNLIESELFGHEKGSFTGADRMRRGQFEVAQKGTIFLDEITEMPIELQVKLLRVLESRSLMRVGSTEKIEVDVRVIAATNRAPLEAVAEQKLREDLYYRLNVFPLILPPLRDRREDVEVLAEHFLDELNLQEGTAKRFSGAAIQRLMGHPWPGNVRELKNLVQSSFILAEETIGLDHIPLGAEKISGEGITMKVGMSLAEAERRLILATMEHCQGNKIRASEVLGISLKTLYNRLNEYNAMTRQA